MQDTIKQKLTQTIKVGFFLSFLIVQFFWFGILPKAQAGSNSCGFNITFGANPTTVATGQTLTFNVGLTANPGTFCISGKVTVAVWVNLSSGNTFTPLFNQVYLFDNTKSSTISVQAGTWTPPSQVWPGNTIRLFAGAVSGDQTSSINSGNNQSWDTQSGEVDIAIGSGTCTQDSQCANAGSSSNGYICFSGTCVEDINLPVGAHCNSNQSGDDCVNGASCNAQNVCVSNSASTNTASSKCSQNSQCSSAGNDPDGYVCNLSTGACVVDINLPIGSSCNSNQSADDCVNGASCSAQNICVSSNTTNSTSGTGLGTPCTGTGAGTCTAPGQTCTNSVCTAISSAMGNNSATTLFNPLPEQDLTHVFLLIMQGFLAIIGIFAVVFIVVGGVQMVISSGNEEAIAKAKKTIVWAILGLAIALMSFSIIAIVEDFLQVNIPVQPSPTSMVSIINKKV